MCSKFGEPSRFNVQPFEHKHVTDIWDTKVFKAPRRMFLCSKVHASGVLMLHPQIDADRANGQNYLAHFRQSMKKFSTTENTTFSVVDHSCP